MLHYKYDPDFPRFYIYYGNTQVGILEYVRHSVYLVEIEYLWIDEQYRNKGYGTCFLQKFIETCNKNNVSLITLMTIREYPDAIRLYYRAGFKITSDMGGEIYMEKRL